MFSQSHSRPRRRSRSQERQARRQDGRDAERSRPPPYGDEPQEHEALLGNVEQTVQYGAVDPPCRAADRNLGPCFRATLLSSAAIALALAIFYVGCAFIYTTNSAANESRRREWAKEDNHRAVLREAWTVEVSQHTALQAKMEEDRRTMDLERKRWDIEWEAYERRKEEARKDEEKRKEDAKREEEQRKEKARKEEEKRKEDMKREEELRRDVERREREEKERRMRDQLFWEGLGPTFQCLRYGTMEYSATLAGRVPLGYDPREECYKKPAEIHDQLVYPTRCDEQDGCGRPIAKWTVNFEEAACTTWWGYFKDKGCYSTGKRHFEAPLENLQSEDHWREICATTPATIWNVDYDGPTSCAEWGGRKWGMWEVDDGSCR